MRFGELFAAQRWAFFSQRPTPPFATHQHCARGCGGASDLARTAAPWAFISQTPVTRKHCNMDAQGRKYARISERGVRPNGVFFPGRVWKGLVCECPFPSRPGPTRPGPTRPGNLAPAFPHGKLPIWCRRFWASRSRFGRSLFSDDHYFPTIR